MSAAECCARGADMTDEQRERRQRLKEAERTLLKAERVRAAASSSPRPGTHHAGLCAPCIMRGARAAL
ncbi:hypothetical protein CYMTET_14009, partial [Cymbomonas tetramitiformis]